MTSNRDRGIALVLAVLTTLMVSALTAGLVLTTSSETLIGSAFRAEQQALYSAEAAAEWCVAELAAPGVDWTSITAGTTRSSFVDGPPSGPRALDDGSVVDVGSVAGANAGWQLYAYGPLDSLLTDQSRGSQFYVMVLAAPDGSFSDRMKIRALAFGPRGAASIVELNAARGPGGVRVESWVEAR